MAPQSELMELLGIEFERVSGTEVVGTVAADERHHQPWGVVHGGLYTAVIETVATVGAVAAVQESGRRAVGVSNMTDFLRPHRSGRLAVRGTPIAQGRSQQLWAVELSRPEDGKLVARGQVRLQNLDGQP